MRSRVSRGPWYREIGPVGSRSVNSKKRSTCSRTSPSIFACTFFGSFLCFRYSTSCSSSSAGRKKYSTGTSSAFPRRRSTPEEGVARPRSYFEIAMALICARSASSRRESPAAARACRSRLSIICWLPGRFTILTSIYHFCKLPRILLTKDGYGEESPARRRASCRCGS